MEPLQIFLISGPCGVGKTTLTKELATIVPKCAIIHGDDFLHMYGGEYEPPWKEKLAIMWKQIVALTNTFLQHQHNVIIDTVVEDELEWFCRHFHQMGVKIKYVVLRADSEILIERIKQRGDTDLIDRALFLLNQLENETSFNHPYLLETAGRTPKLLAHDIIESDTYELKLNTGW